MSVDEQPTGQRVDRRALLKGAAATGAGLAAWSAPNIKTLGFAPAYAAHCSPQYTFDFGSDWNTPQNCDNLGTNNRGGMTGGINYQTVTKGTEGGFCGLDEVSGNECFEDAAICVTTTDESLIGLTCVLTVTYKEQNTGDIIPVNSTIGELSSTGTLFPFPDITGADESTQYGVSLQCSTNPTCFTH